MFSIDFEDPAQVEEALRTTRTISHDFQVVSIISLSYLTISEQTVNSLEAAYYYHFEIIFE